MTARATLRPSPGAVAIALVLAGIGTAVSPIVGGRAQAQTVESRRDQPTPATLPSPEEMRRKESDRQIGQVAPPDAITSSTAIVSSDRKGKTSYTNPLDHLPAKDRAGTGGRRE